MRVETALYVRSAHLPDDFLRDGRPEVAFVGRSNVGKSSLLNRILGRRALARISSTPGRTRAVNYFLIDGRYYFVDLPGYGYAKAGKELRREWAGLIDSYFRHALPRGHVVQLVDAKVGATPLDNQAHEYLTDLGAEPIVVATKVDRVGQGRRTRVLTEIRRDLELGPNAPLILFSARSGEGVKELWSELLGRLQPGARSET